MAGVLQKGYRLAGVNAWLGLYEFVPKQGEEQNQTVRIDYRTFARAEDFTDYITLFADCGWRHLGGSRYSGLQFFEKLGAAADEQIFSSPSSKAEAYKRMAKFWLGMGVVMLPIVVNMQLIGAMDISRWFHFKQQYLTPGLWQATGFGFWRMFLFETPFALGRAFFGFVPLVVLLFCLGMALWVLQKYWVVKYADRRMKNEP